MIQPSGHQQWSQTGSCVFPPPQAILSRMQLALHATRRTPDGASCLVLAMPAAWSVKTRRAPSRQCRDARVYGHTTTAMHDNEFTPLPSAATPPALSKHLLFCYFAPRKALPPSRTYHSDNVISRNENPRRSLVHSDNVISRATRSLAALSYVHTTGSMPHPTRRWVDSSPQIKTVQASHSKYRPPDPN